MKHLFPFFSSIMLCLIIGCTQRQEVDIEVEMPKVKEVVDAFTKTLETEDMQMFEKIASHDEDMVNFGTDAAERWIGYTALKEAVQKQFDAFESTKMTVRDQVIKVHKSGEAAWFSEIADWNVIDRKSVV